MPRDHLDLMDAEQLREHCRSMQAAHAEAMHALAADWMALDADLERVGLMIVRAGGVSVSIRPGCADKLRAAFNL